MAAFKTLVAAAVVLGCLSLLVRFKAGTSALSAGVTRAVGIPYASVLGEPGVASSLARGL
jgi:hypothetical protein